MPLFTTPPGREVVLYDGACPLCRRGAARLVHLAGGRAELRSFRDAGALAPFPGVTAARCELALHLVRADGRVLSGAEAIAEALGGPSGVPARLYQVPPLRRLADAAYRAVARRRFGHGHAERRP